jgi:hypothetical protein
MAHDMRLLIIALLAAGMCMAFSVQPVHNAVKDTGGQNLPTMNVGMTIDCDTKTLIVTARSNETGKPIAGAKAYLFYTNYAYQVIATGTTGEDGIGSMNVIGNRDYLTSLFILRTDHQQFRSREIEFTYQKCFEAPPDPQANQTRPGNASTPNGNAYNASNATPAANLTPAGNATRPNGTSGPSPAGPQRPAAAPCLPALLIPIITIFKCIKP